MKMSKLIDKEDALEKISEMVVDSFRKINELSENPLPEWLWRMAEGLRQEREARIAIHTMALLATFAPELFDDMVDCLSGILDKAMSLTDINGKLGGNNNV